MAPWLVSIRRPEDAGALAELEEKVSYLPEPDAIRAEIDALNAAGKLPARFRRAIAEWRKQPDSNRVFEAVWLAPRLRERGIRHVHAHFGGLAARTAWLLKSLAGITYSFTGHANDIFCENEFPITNEMLVRGAHLIVTETDYAREWMAGKYPFARGKLARVYNGIAIEDFHPRGAAGTERAAADHLGRSICRKEGLWRFDRSLPAAAAARQRIFLRDHWKRSPGWELAEADRSRGPNRPRATGGPVAAGSGAAGAGGGARVCAGRRAGAWRRQRQFTDGDR